MTAQDKKGNFILPKIVDLSSAISVANHGFWAAVIVAGLTILAVTFAVIITGNFSDYAWSYADAILFGFIAWRIKHRSRFFAVFGLCFFVVEVAALISQGKLYSIAVLIAFALLMSFINGIRGTFAIRRFSRKEGAAAVQRENPI